MSRKTYKYNGILLGVLAGMYLGVKADSAVLMGILAVVLAVVFVKGIELLENFMYNAIDAATSEYTIKRNRNK